MSVDVRAETVSLLTPKPGDIIHVKVGIADLGDGQGPWVPSNDDLELVKEAWEEVAPEGVKIVVTHFGMTLEVVRSE